MVKKGKKIMVKKLVKIVKKGKNSKK